MGDKKSWDKPIVLNFTLIPSAHAFIYLNF